MNNRIKELAEQAGSTHKQSLGVYQFYEHEMEKFTELIVQECINVGQQAFLNDHSSVPVFPAEKIRENFRIK